MRTKLDENGVGDGFSPDGGMIPGRDQITRTPCRLVRIGGSQRCDATKSWPAAERARQVSLLESMMPYRLNIEPAPLPATTRVLIEQVQREMNGGGAMLQEGRHDDVHAKMAAAFSNAPAARRCEVTQPPRPTPSRRPVLSESMTPSAWLTARMEGRDVGPCPGLGEMKPRALEEAREIPEGAHQRLAEAISGARTKIPGGAHEKLAAAFQ